MIHVSDHAVERYVDRVKPCLTPEQAREEMTRLLEHVCGFSDQPPVWHTSEEPFEVYAIVTDGIAFGIKHGIAVTCITRGGVGEEVREYRNQRRRNRRGVTAAKRRTKPDSLRTNRERASKPRRKDWRDAAA